jgi:hypothetical protein
VSIYACSMVGYSMLLSNHEDDVKGVSRHNLWLHCLPESGVHGI